MENEIMLFTDKTSVRLRTRGTMSSVVSTFTAWLGFDAALKFDCLVWSLDPQQQEKLIKWPRAAVMCLLSKHVVVFFCSEAGRNTIEQKRVWFLLELQRRLLDRYLLFS